MGISIDKIFNHPQNKINKANQSQAAPAKKVSGRQFDEIVISSYKDTKEDNVNKVLAQKVNSEINIKTDDEKIIKLKEAVDSNSYVINAEEIAKKLLGL